VQVSIDAALSLGRPELQAFYGVRAGQKAKKGVFITTSAFTAQALDFAKSVVGIVLVDGSRLASLMVEFELGVTARTVKISKIDGDYFDEEAV
jgi:restriction system protein